ncbi:hypothetical protein C8R47DRAFT_1215610 [Mycena vitilis]|nr:hypothetical protein C8R47DRAFT_1215610 [Mycena vitilis]
MFSSTILDFELKCYYNYTCASQDLTVSPRIHAPECRDYAQAAPGAFLPGTSDLTDYLKVLKRYFYIQTASDLILKAIVQDAIFEALARCTATVPLPTLSATETLKLQFHLLVNGQERNANLNAAANWVSENLVDVLRPLVRHCQKLETERKAKNIPRPTAFTELASFWRAQDNDTPAQAPQGGL